MYINSLLPIYSFTTPASHKRDMHLLSTQTSKLLPWKLVNNYYHHQSKALSNPNKKVKSSISSVLLYQKEKKINNPVWDVINKRFIWMQIVHNGSLQIDKHIHVFGCGYYGMNLLIYDKTLKNKPVSDADSYLILTP